VGKGFTEYLKGASPDIAAIQETKVNQVLSQAVPHGYSAEWCFARRSGYSGTLCLFKQKPMSVSRGFGESSMDVEGRLIALEYPGFIFVNVYAPNSQGGLERQYFRQEWDAHFREFVCNLQVRKPVIIAGDFNVAHEPIDVYPENTRNMENFSGFLTEEQQGFSDLLDAGLVDVFRHLHPTEEGAYTWWSNRLNKRGENRGWRLDYFLASSCLIQKVRSCAIRSDIKGSDHAPIELTISL